jgi:hypothetical protein
MTACSPSPNGYLGLPVVIAVSPEGIAGCCSRVKREALACSARATESVS